MWKRLESNGHIYKGTYSGWYCVSDEAYYTEDEMTKNAEGNFIAPSGHPVEWMEQECYFLKLSAFQDKLIDLYERHPELLEPTSRRNEVLSFLKGGVQDISISRTTFDWGVKVPGDEAHVMYVWIDALTNYLSALDWPNGEDMKYWPALHLVGKDILRFHAVYWPAMLLGAGFTEEQLPKIFAHGWFLSGGKKMSKSFGNVIDPKEITERYGVDQVRYFLMREVPFGQDGDFSTERFIERVNSDLANSLGNLFQRVLSMVQKNCDGKVPALGELSAEDEKFIAVFEGLMDRVRPHMESLAFNKALEEIWAAVAEANRYMDTKEPWKLRKENPAGMAHVLRILSESFKYFAVLCQPFMPESSSKMLSYIGFSENAENRPDLSQFFSLKEGAELPPPSGIFMRLEQSEAA